MTSVVWHGLTELGARLAKAAVAAPVALGGSLYVEATGIIAESLPITPIEFGTLRSSAFVNRPSISPTGAEVMFGFGGAASDYALIVHEDPNATHAPPTQWKYLEQPALEHQSGLAERLGAHLEFFL